MKQVALNFGNIHQVIKTDNLLLRPIKESDRKFINGLFQDEKIKFFYIVPKESRQDYGHLIDYWLNDAKNGAGVCWIIIQKGRGLFSSDKECGFFSFEFRDSIKNARISYALHPNFRGKGLINKATELVINILKSNGIVKIEADIDMDNFESEKVVEKFGFTANKRIALVDPEMMRDGEIRMRALWKKELIEISSSNSVQRIPLNANAEQLVSVINKVGNEINSKGKHPVLLTQYFYLLGRIKFIEGNYDEAFEQFNICSKIIIKEGMPMNYEIFYWFARIRDTQELKKDAKMYYNLALENYNDNPNLISRDEILSAMNK